MAHRKKLTGRTRGRPSLFLRVIVLQVEEALEQASLASLCCPPMMGQDGLAMESPAQHESRIEKCWRQHGTAWRDATWQDLHDLAQMADEHPLAKLQKGEA